MNEYNEDECLEDRPMKKLKDAEVIKKICEIGIENISLLQQMHKENRDYHLKMIKDIEGVSIRQLSRITGISRSVIDRAK